MEYVGRNQHMMPLLQECLLCMKKANMLVSLPVTLVHNANFVNTGAT